MDRGLDLPDPRGHLQATGRDARGRKQYRYHPRWREVRDETKYAPHDRLRPGAAGDPPPHVDADLRRAGLPREKVLAAVVRLLEKTLIRVGNDEYAQEQPLVRPDDDARRARRGQRRTGSASRFRGKSGVEHEIDLDDRRLARIVKACRDLPGTSSSSTSTRTASASRSGRPTSTRICRRSPGKDFTSKDFRTWAGTVLAAQLLREFERVRVRRPGEAQHRPGGGSVAKRLGNTKAVCRKCYIHPAVFDAYLDGSMLKTVAQRARKAARKIEDLSEGEAAVLGLLERRLAKETRRRAS